MFKGSLAGVLAVAAVFAAAPANAATSFTDTLGPTGVSSYRFSFGGGALQINVNSTGLNPIGDPEIFVFADNGSPFDGLTGGLLGNNDDANGSLNSQLNLNLGSGSYILSVGRWDFTESEARSGNAGGNSAGTSFTVTFDQTVGLVPEPSTWALLILGFGVVGAGMRRRASARVAFA